MARAAVSEDFIAACKARWPDKLARLRDGFYTIKDKAGREIPFRMNADQEEFITNRHGMDLILKARQKGFCLHPDTRVLTADLRWVRIADLRPGTEIIGVDEYPEKGRGKSRCMRLAHVVAVVQVYRKACRITFDDGREIVCTGQHPWLSKKVSSETAWRSIEGSKPLNVGAKVRFITKPWGEPDYDDGWFGGMLDGEGSIKRGDNIPRLSVCQRPTDVWRRMEAYCAARGYHPYSTIDLGDRPNCYGNSPVHRLEFGRMDEMMRVLGQTRPTRFIGHRFWDGRVLPGKRSDAVVWARIVSIEPLAEQTMIDLQTTTGTYIAEGFVSHNTTVIQLDMLDDCLFIPNTAAGVVAHNLNDAKAFFADKIKFAYDNLPPEFKALVGAEQDSADSLRFTNGSSIRVGTSLRSGTLQRLHVSEYGKLCAKFPDKAKEVKTGAFNTVHVGQKIVVESTAEGQEGHFFELCQIAQKLALESRELTALDFKFHFAPWWTGPEYVLDADVVIVDEMAEYFATLAAKGINLTSGQKAWYAKKAIQQDDAMKREYPSTPEEAFEASVEGAYLAKQMAQVRREGRICRVPVLSVPVDTFWDLGINDDMVVWFRQTVGPEHRFIGYYANSGEGMEHYARILQEMATERGWNYGTHHLPHDGAARRLGLKTDSVEVMANSLGIKPTHIVPRVATDKAGIEASRRYIRQCWFDEAHTAEGIKCLDNFRKEWDDERGVYRDQYRHDWASHGYKAFETAARAPIEYDNDDDGDWNTLGGNTDSVAGY